MSAFPVHHVHDKTFRTFLMELTIASIPIAVTAWLMNKLMKTFDEGGKKDTEKRKIHERLKRTLKRPNLPMTNSYEDIILSDIIFPEQLTVSFDDIGGLTAVKEQILETVILPLQNPELFASVNYDNTKSQRLVSVPKGVLFYGPPGTGKTMMAKAIAKTCQATFINLQLSTLQNKYFGESQKLIRALFSIAKKFAPSIIFIDEIDMFLKERGGRGDHEASASMKAEFMSLWDGLMTNDSEQITVLGATNRPFDIDKAILRRLPRTFLFDLPNDVERQAVLEVILANHRKTKDFEITELAKKTQGYCGSDLHELCKYAALIPIREVLREHMKTSARGTGLTGSSTSRMLHLASADSGVNRIPLDLRPRPLSLADCYKAMEFVRPTGASSYEYQTRFQEDQARSTGQTSGSGGVGGSGGGENMAEALDALVELMRNNNGNFGYGSGVGGNEGGDYRAGSGVGNGMGNNRKNGSPRQPRH